MPREWMTRPSLALCGLLVLNAVLWGPTLRYGFVFDDLVNIVENPWIRDPAVLAGVVIGVALYRSGRRDEGLRHIEESVRLAPDNAEYRGNLEAGRGGEAER